MSLGSCEKPGCTVAETGLCLMSKELQDCPHYQSPDDHDDPKPTEVAVDEHPSEPPISNERRFQSGMELGAAEAAEVMRRRYSYLIGILGLTGAGKTCFLLSLYLKASMGRLAGLRFAGSRTLPGFESRARRLRLWRGGPLPEHLADRTRVDQERQPGLLHLALRREDMDDLPLDVLLTDLPGEWTRNLVDRESGARRFGFLNRADGILLVVEAPVLDAAATKHAELQHGRHLLERLRHTVKVATSTPLVLVISKIDLLDGNCPAAAHDLVREARMLGFAPTLVPCSAFSRDPSTVGNGHGVLEALLAVVDSQCASPPGARSAVLGEQSDRVFRRIGHTAP